MITALRRSSATFGARLRQSSATLDHDAAMQDHATRASRYDVLEQYYRSEIYDRPNASNAALKAWSGLPRNIRPLSLVPKRAVDWWPGQVYGGGWTADGLPASNGRPNRIPYDADTPEELRLCSQQALTWANGPTFLTRYVRGGAIRGDAFFEIVDHRGSDPASAKVYPRLLHPRFVAEIELSDRGDVKRYVLSIPTEDPRTGQEYVFGKEVTKEAISTFYNDQPHGYDDQDAVIPNPYGFVPAVWVNHIGTDGDFGAAAIDGLYVTLNEINGLIGTVDDYIHRFVMQGVAVASDDPKGLFELLKEATGLGSTHDLSDPNRQRQSINMFPVPKNATFHHMLTNLGLSESDPHIQRLIDEVEKTLPEIVLDEKLLDMDTVHAPGALPLVKRVQQKLDDVAGNYDLGIVKAGQMCAAIGGHLIATGAWGSRSRLTPQQQKFAPFGLESYQRGELDFGIVGRELAPPTMLQRTQEALAIEGLRTPHGLRHVGYSDEDIYGVAENGDSQAPDPAPGILAGQGQALGLASAIGQQLSDAFTRGQTGI